MVVALLFLGAYAWPILDPALSTPWVRACDAMTWVAWATFAVDYVVRLGLAQNRGRFFRRNLLDLAVVVLPLLRPLRLLRLVRVLEVLNRAAADSLRGRVAVYVVGGTALVLFVAALAALDAERGHDGANIDTFGDALWWSFATITTVGYGDHYPVTGTGRLVAAGLMLCGIALLGVVTAWLASWLIDRVSEAEEEAQAATRRDVARLTEEIAALRDELSRRPPS
jgi:voltage-gated potassium channel